MADLSLLLVQGAHFGELCFGLFVVGVILEGLTIVALGHALIIHVEVGLASQEQGLHIVGLALQQDAHHGHHT